MSAFVCIESIIGKYLYLNQSTERAVRTIFTEPVNAWRHKYIITEELDTEIKVYFFEKKICYHNIVFNVLFLKCNNNVMLWGFSSLSTAMVISRRWVNLNIIYALHTYIHARKWQLPYLKQWYEVNGRRKDFMTNYYMDMFPA